jgi:hypothetical protein
VLVVDAQGGVVEKRNVRSGQLMDGMRVIEDGLGSDEWVVVNGLQRARPGAKVDPEIGEMAAFTASALAPASKAESQPAAQPEAGPAESSDPAAGSTPEETPDAATAEPGAE